MASVTPAFAVRSSTGISVRDGAPKYDLVDSFVPETSKNCRTMLFSPDGKYFAWTNGFGISISLTETWSVIGEISKPKTAALAFSPKSTYLMSWEVCVVNSEQPQGAHNLFIYKTDNCEVVKSFIHKKRMNWELQWSLDESICAQMVKDDVIFYENCDFERIVHRINFAKIGAFSLSPGIVPHHVLCYTAGAKGQPALCRLFKYPKFDAQQSLGNKSFFQADKIDFYWNNKGSSALLMTTTEVDKTGASYYGKQTLHYMATNGTSAMVPFSKEGPVYNVAWSPKNTEFCVVYGFMPSKATIFNLKCEPVFELGTAPRNAIHYNPQGNILLLAGFGNLRGHMELWDMKVRKIISKCEAPDTTVLQWCPDGIHFITATTAPRLRIGNGFKLWHYSGTLLFEKMCQSPNELYEICWQPYEAGVFKEPEISFGRVTGIEASQPQPSKQVYRPPCARGKTAVTFNLHDEETQEKVISKATLKLKKMREARKAKKLENPENKEPADTENKEKLSSSINVVLTGDPEKDKKIKALKKKLTAILVLKEQQAAGKALEINQLAKIKNEDELLQELKLLQLHTD